jgi:hypothetical protein
MSRNTESNIIANFSKTDFNMNDIDIINDQQREKLGERDLKNLFTTLDITNVGNFFEEYNLANEKDKKKYKKIVIDKLSKILKRSPNFNKQNVEKYYEILFADYKKLFDCCIKPIVPKITKNPLDQDTINILKRTLDSFNIEPDENSQNIIEFEDIHQYYIFLMIILAGDPLHDYTISRLTQFRNERGVQNLRSNYSNIATTLFEEYKQCLNGIDPLPLVFEIKDLIVSQNNIEEGLMNALINFKINEQNEQNNPRVDSLDIYKKIKDFLEVKKQMGRTYRFASVNSVSRIHADDREPSIPDNRNIYHTHFIQQSMNKTQYCLPSTMIDGCKGCCDDFSKVYNYNKSTESDRENIGVEIGNINIKFTYMYAEVNNYLTIKSVINKKTNQNNEEIYNYAITISRVNNLLNFNLTDPFTFEREIYPNVDDITVSKMFSKYRDNNGDIYGIVLQNNNLMSNLNAHKYTEKMLCDFLQGAACYFKWGGYGIPSGDPRIQYPIIEYFPPENNILKYNETQTIDNQFLTNISNVSTYNGNCIRVTEHTDRPAAILCHFILQSGFININDFAHAAYLGESNGFLSNKDGIVVETLNIVVEEHSFKKQSHRYKSGGGFLNNKNYETYINNDNDNRASLEDDDVVILFKYGEENSANDIIIFADEFPNNDTIRWASCFNYNEEQIHQINFITILVILNLDENELDENETQFVKFLKSDIDENRKPDVNNIYYKRYKHFFESINYFKSNPEIFAKLFNTSISVEVVLKNLVSAFVGLVKSLIKEKEESVKEEEGSVGNNDSSFSSNLSSDSGRVLLESREGSTVESREGSTEGSTVNSREGSEQGSPLLGPKSADSSQIKLLPPLVIPLQTSEQKSANSPAELFRRLSMSTEDSLKKNTGGNKRNRKTQKTYTKKTKKTKKKVNKKRHTAHRKTHKKKYVKSKHHKTYKY